MVLRGVEIKIRRRVHEKNRRGYSLHLDQLRPPKWLCQEADVFSPGIDIYRIRRDKLTLS